MTLQTGDGKWHYSKTFPSAFFFLNSADLCFVKNQRTFTMHLCFTQQAFKVDINNRVLITHVDICKGYIDYQISQNFFISMIFRIVFWIESDLLKNHILGFQLLILFVNLKKHNMFFLVFLLSCFYCLILFCKRIYLSFTKLYN